MKSVVGGVAVAVAELLWKFASDRGNDSAKRIMIAMLYQNLNCQPEYNVSAVFITFAHSIYYLPR